MGLREYAPLVVLSMKAVRVERDSIGEREIPQEAYYGINSLRAQENFPVSGVLVPGPIVRAYGYIKLAAVRANRELGALDGERSKAIEQAAQEFLQGKFDRDIIVDAFQAGAGTSTNMNVNEILANRALELSGKPRGDYTSLSPNDHINMGQSTNDTYPTALNLGLLLALKDLEVSVRTVVHSLRGKEQEFASVPKSGRTHLKDAMPITLGAEFGAYASVLERVLDGLPRVREGLCEVPLGGNAVGTGVNTRSGYRTLVVQHLASATGFPFRPSRDPFEGMQSRWAALATSGFLRGLAVELSRISNDLRLLSSGPATGLDEIRLPEVQAGSSIMPAKVNPSLAECLNQICFHIIGSDLGAAFAAEAGQLEINVMMPVMSFEILFSMKLLTNFLPVFAAKGVDGITANPEKCNTYLLASSSIATILTPRLGYLKVAEAIKKSAAAGISVKAYLEKEGLLSPAETEQLLGREALLKITRPVA